MSVWLPAIGWFLAGFFALMWYFARRNYRWLERTLNMEIDSLSAELGKLHKLERERRDRERGL